MNRTTSYCGAAAALLLLGLVPPARAAEYEIGPGKRYPTLGAVEWDRLGPGDTVRVHWQPEPYREKLKITCSGAAGRPVRILGVPGPAGQKPVLEGDGASTPSQFRFSYAPTQDRGLVIFTQEWRKKPRFIELSGLELRGAHMSHTFRDAAGAPRTYSRNAAALFVERGEDITVRDCVITGSGNGLFVASGGSEELQSRHILVDGCSISGNGNVGSEREHNLYTEAIGLVIQNSRFGPLRPGALGNNIKDRSAGTVIRYNRIEDGAHLLDLVEAQESWNLTGSVPGYHRTFVYGNVLVNGPGGGERLVHYGGDDGNPSRYRNGTLYFFHNTVVNRADQTGARRRWRSILFQAEDEQQRVEAVNNVFVNLPATPGAPASELTLMDTNGSLVLKNNWISPGWIPSRSGAPFTGSIRGAETLIRGAAAEPGFVDLEKGDFRLRAGSPALGRAASLELPPDSPLPGRDLEEGARRLVAPDLRDLGAAGRASGGQALLDLRRWLEGLGAGGLVAGQQVQHGAGVVHPLVLRLHLSPRGTADGGALLRVGQQALKTACHALNVPRGEEQAAFAVHEALF